MLYNGKEELANTISHGLGFILGLILLPTLPYEFPYFIYAFGFLFIFLSSTFYHASRNYDVKRLAQKVDHIAIYFMIAGSYTPFIFECLDHNNAWLFFCIIWGIVLLGTVFKLFLTGRFEKLSLVLYLSMGWMVMFIIKPFVATFDVKITFLVILGGLFYSCGVYFYAKDHKKYYHFVWHLFVLGGAMSHFLAISNIMK